MKVEINEAEVGSLVGKGVKFVLYIILIYIIGQIVGKFLFFAILEGMNDKTDAPDVEAINPYIFQPALDEIRDAYFFGMMSGKRTRKEGLKIKRIANTCGKFNPKPDACYYDNLRTQRILKIGQQVIDNGFAPGTMTLKCLTRHHNWKQGDVEIREDPGQANMDSVVNFILSYEKVYGEIDDIYSDDFAKECGREM